MKSVDLLKVLSGFFESSIARSCFARHVHKLKICSFDEERNRIHAEYQLGPEDCDHDGSANKGLITLISDELIGLSSVLMTRPNAGGVTVGLNMKFMNDAKAGDLLDIAIDHKDTKPNKDLVTVTSEVMNRTKGTMIAVGTQTHFIKQLNKK